MSTTGYAYTQIIARLTGDDSVFILLQRLADVPLQKQWTKHEARLMAKNNYRQSYLPKMGN